MLRILRARLGDAERGLSLVIVISVGAVLTLLMTVMMSYGITAHKKSTEDEQWNAAFAAAYAGVEEYLSRLANDPAYVRYGNPLSTFSAGGKVALPPPAAENPAFGVGAAGTWADVPGSGGNASFRYEVDESEYLTTGTLRLRSTGRVGEATRTIVAELRQTGFIDFLYFTDYEMQDPTLSGAPANCVRYEWVDPRPASCSNISFGFSDVLEGPVHSNDTIRACGSRFRGPVTTSSPPPQPTWLAVDSNNSSCSGQIFDVPGYPSFAPTVGMPKTNSQMRKEVRTDLGADVPNPGCLYTGPTRIILNADGTITVRSPWTRATRVAGEPATSGSTPAECGDIAQLNSTAGATFVPPANNLIYVQNVPAIPADPNYWSTDSRPVGLNCTGERASSVRGSNAIPGAGNGIGYPMAFEQAPLATSYACRVGDVFTEGVLNGRLTVAAENYVYITGDITYADATRDVLGLVGNNSIFVWNPVSQFNRARLTDTNRRIEAAMISVERTVQVQNFDRGGPRGTLVIRGALAQRFRGIVAVGFRSGAIAHGYGKDYAYDPRLKYTAPPKFLSPIQATFDVNVWIETERAFNPDGSPR